MRGSCCLFAFFAISFAQASWGYKFQEFPSLGKNTGVQAASNGTYAAATYDGVVAETFIVGPSQTIRVNETHGLRQSTVTHIGPNIISFRLLQRSNENFARHNGYLHNGKLEYVVPAANTEEAYILGGSETGWITGYSTFRTGDGFLGSVAFLYNPTTGERIDTFLSTNNHYMAGNSKNEFTFVTSPDEPSSGTSNAAFLRRGNTLKYIGSFVPSFINNQSTVVGDGFGGGFIWTEEGGERLIPNAEGGVWGLSHSGTIITRTGGESKWFWHRGDTMKELIPTTMGFPTGTRIDGLVVDPYTDQLYVRLYEFSTRRNYTARLDPVPEPGTLAALGLGLAALARRRRMQS